MRSPLPQGEGRGRTRRVTGTLCLNAGPRVMPSPLGRGRLGIRQSQSGEGKVEFRGVNSRRHSAAGLAWTGGGLRRPRFRRLRLRLGRDRIEADIDEILVERRGRGRDREAQRLPPHRRTACCRWLADVDRDHDEFGRDRPHPRRRRFLNHRKAQRDADLAGAAGRPEHDASFDADLHHHVAFDRGAFAGQARSCPGIFPLGAVIVALAVVISPA